MIRIGTPIGSCGELLTNFVAPRPHESRSHDGTSQKLGYDIEDDKGEPFHP